MQPGPPAGSGASGLEGSPAEHTGLRERLSAPRCREERTPGHRPTAAAARSLSTRPVSPFLSATTNFGRVLCVLFPQTPHRTLRHKLRLQYV